MAPRSRADGGAKGQRFRITKTPLLIGRSAGDLSDLLTYGGFPEPFTRAFEAEVRRQLGRDAGVYRSGTVLGQYAAEPAKLRW